MESVGKLSVRVINIYMMFKFKEMDEIIYCKRVN